MLHRVGQFFRAHVERQGRTHFAGEIETIGIDVGNDDVARTGMPANRNGHATDRACAGDEDILADKIEGKCGVHGVSQRIEAGKDIE